MRDVRGFTVLELLVAVAILLLVTSAVTVTLHDNLLGTPVLEEATDLQQRTRIAADTLASDLRAVGSGTEAGPLSHAFATVVPRTAAMPANTTSPSAVTIRYAPPDAARSRLAAQLLPGDAIALLAPDGACVRSAIACGFTAATLAVVVDPSGQADIVSIDAVGPGTLAISDLLVGRTATYPAGAHVTEVVEVTYRLDAGARQLRKDAGGGSFAVAENVTQVQFEYFGSMAAPTEPKPPLGTSNCLYAADGSRVPYAWGVGTGSMLDSLPLGSFADGPFCGSGRLSFDADLLKVRAVRVVLRLETGVDRMRGTDPRLFARPGTATGVRMLPDSVVVLNAGLRNPGR